MNSEAKVCAECGSPMVAGSPEGFCPRCLLKQGLADSRSVVGDQLSVDKTVLDSGPHAAPSAALPREGQRFGDYQLVRMLGQGGMGTVFEAEHLPSERRVALKVLNHALDSPEARKRFLREGQLAASINHPNSIYVFGTEEIDGIPVISMELAPGGTLKDRVKEKGPLPVTEAVDVILQVIAGLEAAHAKGVLHRDIKPSNCFVDADGTVKVGDFGLSISTHARAETQLTTTGRILGTPAFASPEQLRGDELDVRSDIYSVGATLYYLLTGKVPFEETNLVKLLTMAVERPAESPAKLRREIPKQLAQTVLRCLAKAKRSRYADYDELRQALLPLGSDARKSPSLSLRFLAGCIDIAALIGAIAVARYLWLDEWLNHLLVSDRQVLAWTSAFWVPAFFVLYFTVVEGIWGATLGKRLCSLRVVRQNGEAPGLDKALVRALIFHFAFFELGDALALALRILGPVEIDWGSSAGLVGVALLFSMARRKNGFAAWHDRLSQTLVIQRRPSQPRRKTAPGQEPPLAVESNPRIGPYHILGKFRMTVGELLLGYDLCLRRRVWIHKLPTGSPPLAISRRVLNRTGRSRWLNGKRTAGECWDAYEAVDGDPLLNLLNERQPWERVRHWLTDLAEELEASFKDRSLPVLGLDRVWITAESRAKLLDFPAPELADFPASLSAQASDRLQTDPFAEMDFANVQDFLHQIAVAALRGSSGIEFQTGQSNQIQIEGSSRFLPSERPSDGQGQMVAIPLHASTFLADLAARRYHGLKPLVSRLKAIMDEVAVISRRKRLGLILGWLLLPLGLTLVNYYSWIGDPMFTERFAKQREFMPILAQCFERLETLRKLSSDWKETHPSRMDIG